MSNAQKTIAVYNQFGILDNCKKLSTEFNHESKQWEVWGHFQSKDGRKNARVAQFDTCKDAVDFKVLAGF